MASVNIVQEGELAECVHCKELLSYVVETLTELALEGDMVAEGSSLCPYCKNAIHVEITTWVTADTKVMIKNA